MGTIKNRNSCDPEYVGQEKIVILYTQNILNFFFLIIIYILLLLLLLKKILNLLFLFKYYFIIYFVFLYSHHIQFVESDNVSFI